MTTIDDTRDRLIELLAEADNLYSERLHDAESASEALKTIKSVYGIYADHLLANGVIVQEWISVEDRLPENSEDVVVCHRNGWVTKDAWLGSNWWYQNDVNPITHWIPLPQPPEEAVKALSGKVK